MKEDIKVATQNDLPFVLTQLRRNGVRNAWAIQDITVWPDASKLFFCASQNSFSYLLISGHPASHDQPTLIVDGEPTLVSRMLKQHAPDAPFVVRETSSHLLDAVKAHCPDARIYLEQRMDVTKETFTPKHKGLARNLTESDAECLAQFFGAPPQAAGRFKGWLKGARLFLGAFQGDRLAAIGSTMVNVPEAWNLVSIETHKEFRGKGFATEITSALVARALEETNTVTVTVVVENAAAIRTYEKVGFKQAEGRIWADNGTGSAP